MEPSLRALTIRQLKERLRVASTTIPRKPEPVTGLSNDLVGMVAIYATWEATFRVLCLAKELTSDFYRDRLWKEKLDAEFDQRYPPKSDDLRWIDHYWYRSRLHYGKLVILLPGYGTIPLNTSGYSATSQFALQAESDRADVWVHDLDGVSKVTYSGTYSLAPGDSDYSERVRSVLTAPGSIVRFTLPGTRSTKYLFSGPLLGTIENLVISDRGSWQTINGIRDLLSAPFEDNPKVTIVDYEEDPVRLLDREGRKWDTRSWLSAKLALIANDAQTRRYQYNDPPEGILQRINLTISFGSVLYLVIDRTVYFTGDLGIRGKRITEQFREYDGLIQYIFSYRTEDQSSPLVLLIDPLTD